MGGGGDEQRSERVALGVGVVGQHALRSGAREGRILHRCVAVRVGDGLLIWPAAHDDGNRGGHARPGGVGGPIGEGIGAAEARMGRVGEGAVRRHTHRAIGRRGDEGSREGIALGIVVIVKHAGIARLAGGEAEIETDVRAGLSVLVNLHGDNIHAILEILRGGRQTKGFVRGFVRRVIRQGGVG